MFISDKFFYGVVEGRNDPLMIGRLQVRIFGIHSPLKVSSLTEGSSTEDLLWCHAMTPITSASISGVGNSPTGAVEGSHVVGFFRDEMCQDGIILGTIPGIPTQPCNPDVGFNDPYGQYPRYINEPDTNTLARGGIVPPLPSVGGNTPPTPPSQTPVTVEEQNLNRSEAPEPDKTPAADITPTPVPGMTIEEMLKFDEGIRVAVYWDSEGYPTIGIGHLIIREATRNRDKIYKILSQHVGRSVSDGRITTDEVSRLFSQDLAQVNIDLARNKTVGPVFAMMDDTRKMAFQNMCFQMGVGGIADFKKFLAAAALKRWKEAHDHMLDSLWARQTPGRANRVSKIILNGNLTSYGVVETAPTYTSERSSKRDLMFKEPESPYAAVYPYNQVYESESGHIQEFDDTPGAERYHRKHPAGTFIEVHPNGTRVVKVVGEDYEIIKSNKNVIVSGDLNVIIEGNAQVYCMGNMDSVVDGNVTQLVRGNVIEQIDGNVEQTINGDNTQHVLGNVSQQVDGNVVQSIKGTVTQSIEGTVTQTIEGDVSQTLNSNLSQEVTGDYNMHVKGNFNQTVDGNITSTATGTAKITGNGASVEMNSEMKLSASLININ